MCQCQPATSEVVRPSIRYSVHERGEAEAQRHKWIESEKAGRDLGNWAILCWVRHHWNGFLRERWLEHLQGRTYWYRAGSRRLTASSNAPSRTPTSSTRSSIV